MKQAAGLWDEKTIQAEFQHPTWPWKAMESHGNMSKKAMVTPSRPSFFL
jgi:hypothetical protein